MRKFTIEEPVFRTATLFILDCDFQTFKRELKRHGRDAGEFIGQSGQMFTFDHETAVAIHKDAAFRCIWTAKPKLRVVLHEVFHLVTRICQDKGVGIKAHLENGECGDETAAYLFEFYAANVLRKLSQWSV